MQNAFQIIYFLWIWVWLFHTYLAINYIIIFFFPFFLWNKSNPYIAISTTQSLDWRFSVSAVFIWTEILFPCKFQACNYESSLGVNFCVLILREKKSIGINIGLLGKIVSLHWIDRLDIWWFLQGFCAIFVQLHYSSSLCPCNSGTFTIYIYPQFSS